MLDILEHVGDDGEGGEGGRGGVPPPPRPRISHLCECDGGTGTEGLGGAIQL